ncbi:MAG: hypothetical protein ACLPKI_05205 [Streptosporangiaceae bacterium]
MTGRMVTAQSWTLDELRHHWGEAYEITDRPRWRARRRDGKGGWLTAEDVEALVEAIRLDYQADPVSRDLGRGGIGLLRT